MTQASKILKFTRLEADFFKYDESGDLPFAIVMAAHPLTDIVVKTTIARITDFCIEFNQQNPNTKIEFSHLEATKICFGPVEDLISIPIEDLEITYIGPDTLILILSYTENREKVITLELADNIEKFTMH